MPRSTADGGESVIVQVIDIDDVAFEERAHVRSGRMLLKTLAVGEPGTPGNFALMLSHTPEGYDSPRHRHSFDQVRYQLEGDFDFAADGVMRPGSLAYFPEGTRYGPQTDDDSSLTLVLQFGGASGSGYLSEDEYRAAAAALAERGTFAGGVYTRAKPGGGKVNTDAYEAVWEEAMGRPLDYPEPRYDRPAFFEPSNVDWTPDPVRPGVAVKALGEFNERGTRLALYRVEPDATLALRDSALYFVTEGAGEAAGRSYRRWTTIHVKAGEVAEIRARERTELLHIGLPRFG
jgi:hypothetical protein